LKLAERIGNRRIGIEMRLAVRTNCLPVLALCLLCGAS
jgi:hypothetical protein